MSRYRVSLVYGSSINGRRFVACAEGDTDARSAADAVRRAKIDLPIHLYAWMRDGGLPRGRLGRFRWIEVQVCEVGGEAK